MTPSHSLGGEGSLLISVMLLEVMLLLSGDISAMLLEKSLQILFFQFIFLHWKNACFVTFYENEFLKTKLYNSDTAVILPGWDDLQVW